MVNLIKITNAFPFSNIAPHFLCFPRIQIQQSNSKIMKYQHVPLWERKASKDLLFININAFGGFKSLWVHFIVFLWICKKFFTLFQFSTVQHRGSRRTFAFEFLLFKQHIIIQEAFHTSRCVFLDETLIPSIYFGSHCWMF